MPSPFPGMDPYLESRALWRDVHHELISTLRSQLNATLPKEFVARIDERLYILEPPRSSFYPDVAVERRMVTAPDRGGVATLAPPPEGEADTFDAPLLFRDEPEEVREAFIEIVAAYGTGQVVTTIELLSPANKTPGAGHEEYVQKRDLLFRSDIHLLEIDLLRGGVHSIAASEVRLRAEHGPWDTIACLHRAGSGYEYEIWARSLRERLPRVRVPLTVGIPDVLLDLQAALDRAYTEGAYDRVIDYTADPEPPLAAPDADWAGTLLREKGLR